MMILTDKKIVTETDMSPIRYPQLLFAELKFWFQKKSLSHLSPVS